MIRVSVVGTGYWGQNLVRNYHSLGALKQVCDLNPSALESVEYAYPEVRVTRHYTDLLSDPETQGIIVATPAASHFHFAQQALEAGKDVYVEKPLALEIDHARALVELARKQKRILMVGHLLQYHPAFLYLKNLVTTGELGKLQYLYSNRLSLGKIRREENALWSFAPHDISMILALTQQLPMEVDSFGSNVLQESVADVTNTFLRFADGLCGHILVSWLHPFKEHKLVVIGDRQMAVFEDSLPWGQKLALYPHLVTWEDGIPVPLKSTVQYPRLNPAEPLALQCKHFLDCIESRQSPNTDGEEGLRVLEVLDRAQRSLQATARPRFPNPHVEAAALYGKNQR
ncbi:MAG: Gfo/Idh/MocA family oxidoreductase [Candidatus Eremiobacteraeota bacterium]|nr:Gfo/Idh/MocA family oxidoreductase [Candidatus Eremiobacteraeota bacterium]MCW5867193.1 Gfo/Idh/MocA family oxidoreductase [Candidatus Eremiobacteraeota bacterium]